jgi:hypothetical protein
MPDRRQKKRARRAARNRPPAAPVDTRVDPRDPARARANRRTLFLLIVLVVGSTLLLLAIEIARRLTSS